MRVRGLSKVCKRSKRLYKLVVKEINRIRVNSSMVFKVESIITKLSRKAKAHINKLSHAISKLKRNNKLVRPTHFECLGH